MAVQIHYIILTYDGYKIINENIGWAVGQYGNILKSTNGGEIWTHQNSNVSQELNDVEFKMKMKVWLLGWVE